MGRFFTDPRTFSAAKDTADYRPLLSAWFALDYKLGGGIHGFIFQAENFLWFTLELVALFQLFRFIPGGNYFSALFGAFLYGLHPIAAQTVNYPLQRGTIMGSFGVIAGLALWIYWPRLLPQKLPLKLKRVPQLGFDEYLRTNYQMLEARYLRLIHLPVGLYLWPVWLGLLVDPAAAVFAPILLVYILLFETERRPRHAIPAAILCLGYWIFYNVFTFRFREPFTLPAWNYWITQPWVAVRYLYAFFVPLHLSAETDLAPLDHIFSPLAIAGYAGVAALILLAVFLSRLEVWRPVAFGLWWFLIALLPWAAVPRRLVEADWRMFLAIAGLAFAVSRTAWIAFALLYGLRMKKAALIGMPALVVALFAVCGWGTWRRNAVWESEASLWSDAMAKSPHNGRAFMRFGLTRMDDDPADGLNYLVRAAKLSPHDAVIEINLAQAYNRSSRVREAEAGFRQAIADARAYSPAYSAYAQWLQSQARTQEGYDMAIKAIGLDPYDRVARRTIMDVLAQWHQWIELKRMAAETLGLYPNDADAARGLLVAQTAIDSVADAEQLARNEPTPDHFLSLSVHYYENQRYEDSIRAAKEALRLNPDLAEAYANIATAWHAMGKLDETIAALREEVRINPDLPSAAHNLDAALAEKARLGK